LVSYAPGWLSTRCAGFGKARAPPWRVLRRLLLDTDDAVACWRRDERALDWPTRVTHSPGEGQHPGPPDRPSCWDGPHRRRRVDAVNGNLLMTVRFDLADRPFGSLSRTISRCPADTLEVLTQKGPVTMNLPPGSTYASGQASVTVLMTIHNR